MHRGDKTHWPTGVGGGLISKFSQLIYSWVFSTDLQHERSSDVVARCFLSRRCMLESSRKMRCNGSLAYGKFH
jgi:hypothetical protein